MNIAEFKEIVTQVEIDFDTALAVFEYKKDDVVIDVYMWVDEMELEIEEVSFELNKGMKGILTKVLKKAIYDGLEEKEEENNDAFTQEDYQHFESLIFA